MAMPKFDNKYKQPNFTSNAISAGAISEKLNISLLKPHLQQRWLISSLPRSSKNIIKSQFNELEAAGPEEPPKKKGSSNLC
ncbi:hypothetical protein NPIL_54581 [Nephila pilipes]|uniref:Uncharacterized protein n=1 Tax=Nephila pilipes TaxID=299642 RepID=A0A8X6UU46_NEPPI|nr:hypothetical protein NPIL_54581 [Nephila pilipes]